MGLWLSFLSMLECHACRVAPALGLVIVMLLMIIAALLKTHGVG